MADPMAEIRRALERLSMQQLDGQAGQRQWSAGFVAQQRQSAPTGAPPEPAVAAIFATGYDSGSGKTIVPFYLDGSSLDGPDVLI